MQKFCSDWCFTYVRITISMYFSIQYTQERNSKFKTLSYIDDLPLLTSPITKPKFKPAKMNKYTSNSNASDDVLAIQLFKKK